MPRSLKSLKDEIRGQTFPGGEAENLIGPHDLLFTEALGQIQQDVVQCQERQANCVQFSDTFFRNGLTVIHAPQGIVKRVYTVERLGADWDWNRPVFYAQAEYQRTETWARNLRSRHRFGHHHHKDTRHNLTFDETVSSVENGLTRSHRRPMTSAIPPMPLGFVHADSSTDTKHRARSGMFAIDNGNIYLAPWIQSSEMIVVEWSGIKPTPAWTDADLVDDSPEFKKAVKLYFQWAHERDYGSDVEKRSSLHEDYRDAISDLMIQKREEERVRRTETMNRPHHHDYLGFKDILYPPHHHHHHDRKADEYVIAHIGNNGCGTPQSEQVSYLVHQWKADAVLAVGGNTVKDANSSAYLPYDYAVGRFWSRLISPYNGGYPGDAAFNSFWPAPDAADSLNGALAPYKSFFVLPNNGRYYDFVVGEAHFFVLNPSATEADGKTSSSKQADWLRMMLMVSTARWKVVVVAVPPYASDTASTDTDLQWPFDAWGADLVLSGDAMSYERLQVARFPYIVNGIGGKSLSLPSPVNANSIKLFAGNYGAGKLTVSPKFLRYELFDINGVGQDCFEIEKGDDMKCPIPNTANASNQIYTGTWANPNGNLVPVNPANPATYYQDQSNPVVVWNWSVQNQNWFEVIGT